MHVFLTGERHIGKTTLLKKVLSQGGFCGIGGFLTGFEEGESETRTLFMYDASDPEHKRAVGTCRAGSFAKGNTEVFDTFGTKLLADSAGTLTVMDEIGKMEKDAKAFSRAVISRLEQDAPVLGVLKKSANTELSEIIRTHPRVRLIEVTEQNRDHLTDEILSLLQT